MNGDCWYLTNDGATVLGPFPVEVMRLDGAAAARCQELWSEARGRPLAARLDGRRLVVNVVKLAADPAALELAAGRVVGCRKFDDTKSARAVLTLTRR